MPAALVKSLARKAGTTVRRAERLWKQAKVSAQKQGRAEDYAYITGILKRMLGIKGESGDVLSSDYPLLLEAWGPDLAGKMLAERMPASVRANLLTRFLEFEKQIRNMQTGKPNWDAVARSLRMATYTLLNWLSAPDKPQESFKKFTGII